jgi:hypothetical protein
MSDSASEPPTLFPAANQGAPLSYYDFKCLPSWWTASESGTSDALLQTASETSGRKARSAAGSEGRYSQIHAWQRAMIGCQSCTTGSRPRFPQFRNC